MQSWYRAQVVRVKLDDYFANLACVAYVARNRVRG